MLQRIDYVVDNLSGDYAFLRRIDRPDEELKCVARALLPEVINEGSKLAYEMLEYTLL